jgi:hypothetical protein
MPGELRWFVVAAMAGVGVWGCTRAEPPAPDASPSVAAPELPAPSSSASSAPVASASTAAPSASVDPSTLPQTRDRPVASGPAFEARVASLWSAIVADDPQQAVPFFFPVSAYQQVKDIPDPASDWKHRLFAAYAHDIHALHARLGSDAPNARFTGIDVPEARGRWVDPGEEYNKLGYYRVFGSRLRYEVDGAARSFDVKSLISWRGEWYVVHLSAIK